MNYQEIAKLVEEKLASAQKIVVIQADNPDGDSLSSALALEYILDQKGKEVSLYCGIDMPEHLKYLAGWDRVSKELPNNFDLAFLVDCGYWQLLNNFEKSYGRAKLNNQNLIIINEHDPAQDMEAAVSVQDPKAVSSGQIIFELFSALGFDFDKQASTFVASSILSDTLGLSSENTTGNPRVFEIMAKLIENGLNIAELQEARLNGLKVSPELLKYRGELLQRVEYHDNGRIATITIPYDELKDRSQEFNPTVILDETRMVEGVAVSIGLKQYMSQGKLVRVTGRIRCNRGFFIADKLAQTFEGGGGHEYASGFKVEGENLDFESIKSKIINRAAELISQQ